MSRTLSELDWLRMPDLWVNTPTFARLGALRLGHTVFRRLVGGVHGVVELFEEGFVFFLSVAAGET